MNESILDPELPIIDPHHHLWDLRPLLPMFPEPRHDFLEALVDAAYYTFDALQADTQSGHRVVGTVFMECGAFYDASRGEALKTVGEVEFVDGVAAQGASGLYGEYRPCAAIVGHADLTRHEHEVAGLNERRVGTERLVHRGRAYDARRPRRERRAVRRSSDRTRTCGWRWDS